jgi:hypothetical protein
MFSFWFLDKGRFVFLSHVKEREAAATVETLAAAASASFSPSTIENR